LFSYAILNIFKGLKVALDVGTGGNIAGNEQGFAMLGDLKIVRP